MSNLYQRSTDQNNGDQSETTTTISESMTLVPSDQHHQDSLDLENAIGEIGRDVDDVSVSGGRVHADNESELGGAGGIPPPPPADDAAPVTSEQNDENLPPDEPGAEENPEDVPQDDEPRYVYEDEVGPPGDDQGETAFEGVLAQDPQEARQQMLDGALEAQDVRVFDETGGKAKRWMPWLIAGLVLVVLIAVGVSLGVIIPRRNASAGTAMPTFSPSEAPSATPSQAPTSSSFAVVAQAVQSAFGMTLDDSTSPQYRAAEWMAEQDQFITSPLDDLARFAQRYAVVVFYYATGGDTSWRYQADFLSPNLDICDWKMDAPPLATTVLGILGVECFGQGVPLAIEFIQNNLAGTIPDEIGALSRLNALLLNQNTLLAGTIPSSIFNSNFQYLSLPFTNITGTIPTEIGQFGTLLQCWFQESSLSGTIPSELGANKGLLALTMAYSFLNGTIPDTLFGLPELIILDISYNNLTGPLPQDISTGWPKMQQASFNGNEFTGPLPQNLDLLTDLLLLSFSENNFTGTIPPSLVNISSLALLNLEQNDLTGSLPSDWSKLSLLEIMSVAENRLTGSIPPSLGNCTLLSTISFADNRFSSTIPPELGNLTNILNILFQENALTGTVPTSFLRWKSLQRLTVTFTEMTGDMSFLCDATDETKPWTPTIVGLHADCLGEVICPCCHLCCKPDDTCEFN